MKSNKDACWPAVAAFDIDAEHQKLSAALAALGNVCSVTDAAAVCPCSSARGKECANAIADLLGELLGVAVDHFKHEETLMGQMPHSADNRQCCDAHKLDHAEIAQALSALAYSLDARSPRQLILDLSGQLHHWIGKHIADHDAALARMLATET